LALHGMALPLFWGGWDPEPQKLETDWFNAEIYVWFLQSLVVQINAQGHMFLNTTCIHLSCSIPNQLLSGEPGTAARMIRDSPVKCHDVPRCAKGWFPVGKLHVPHGKWSDIPKTWLRDVTMVDLK
jgi:hypothetical protein